MPESSLQRAYGMFTRCHQIVAAAGSAEAIAAEVCRAAVEDLGYRLAWVGLLERDSSRILPIGHAGFDEGYLDHIVVSARDDAHGRGPTGTAVRERKVSVCRDIANDSAFAPWREDAVARGYGSSVALPLLEGPRAIGALNLYAVEPDSFDEREIALLEEVALDVALGITALRARADGTPADAEDRNELASAVTASVAHDLQNMLTVVSLSLSDLVKRLPEHTSDAAYLDAQTALQGAVELTRQVLVLSKRATTATETVDVDTCMRAAQPLLRRIAGAPATVSFDLGVGRGRVGLGGLDLQRIVINLVLNAAQSGGDGVQIRIETRTDGEQIVLRVRDDGPGIPSELVPHVFEARVSTKGSGGVGLGLASVAQLARAVGGVATVESEVGQGATFTVRMPRVSSAR